MSGFLSRTDADWQREVDSGKIQDFGRSDADGLYRYIKTAEGDTLIKDVEPADTAKGYQQTDFLIHEGRISEIHVHND